MSMNDGEIEDLIVWQITMNHDWYMDYKMFDSCNDTVYYIVHILGWLNVEIKSRNEGWGLVKDRDEDHLKKNWVFWKKNCSDQSIDPMEQSIGFLWK